MGLEQIAGHFGEGGAFLSGKGPGTVKKILTELQGLSFAVADGAAADTGITVNGITAKDTLKFVLGIQPGVDVVDFTADFEITDADEITAATQATTDYYLVVVWYDKE